MNTNMNADEKRYFVFLLLTGLRPSEALAIKWSDINYEKGIIHIEHTLIRDNNLPKGERLALGTTKEDTPKDISIDDIHILNILRDQQIYVKSLREKFGTEFKHPEIIFPSGKGNYRDLGALRKALNRVTEGTEFAFLRTR